ncbi:DUF4328 domain-containing protein [Streptomyces sp. HUAS TT20]|uniref:DUF4328 domain-containing protein n=1 Tax=Streptomyces sp. HUAS TT20 TaxID=3447509 RepID=UPI0021D8D304|nr:DUF4328 domain-containing protein [Streptomyces sp. HUAS 15-9]UXY29483.1 DUF4328 domain-containing protein [Streptomyces sp. HUAS 15-9]
MICSRCHHFAAAPGGTLCTRCAGEPPAPMPANAGAPYAGMPYTAATGAWLRSPVVLGRAAAAALGLVIATDLFAIWADILELDVLSDLVGGARGSDVVRRTDRADLYGTSGIAQGVALVASTVVFLCWFYRVRVNAEVFDASGHSKSRGWAIGGWFTPVVNLWFPRRITLDTWDASSPWGKPASHALVNAWWTLWIISLFAGRAALTQNRRAESATELRDATRTMLFSDALDVAAAVLAILVVLRLTRMQHHKALAGPVPDAV